MGDEIIAARISLAEAYLIALRDLSASDWLNLYNQYRRGQLSLAESIAICHPRYYGELMDAAVSDIRGPRRFGVETVANWMHCGSKRIWGYDCPMHVAGGDLAADHLFPYAYGGPTDPDNKLYLCPEHNRLKGCDVHTFPWNVGEPHWLRGLLARIHYQLR